MTTKYPMPKPLSHHELRIAYDLSAEIEYLGSQWYRAHDPNWRTDVKFRVKPDCQYALAKIAELGGDEMADIYQAWLDGADIEVKPLLTDWQIINLSEKPSDYPFKQFQEMYEYWNGQIRIKKKKVEKFLWVCSKSYWDSEFSYRPEIFTDKDCVTIDDILEAGYAEYSDMVKQKWHKVPSFTREVEV